MRIQFNKGQGKPDTLTCVRDDGSRTWAALNFTAHDFGHYALETTLGWRDAFFGLLAQGWDIADFARRDPATGRKPAVPTQALQAEAIAGLVDIERRAAAPPDHALFTEMLGRVCEGLNIPAPPLTRDQLAAIRLCHSGLLQQWQRLPEGAALELSF